MKSWTARLGLSLFVMMGFWSNPLPAQYPTLPLPGPKEAPQVLVVPMIFYEPDHHPPYPMPLEQIPPPAPGKYFYQRALNHFGLWCQPQSDQIGGNILAHTKLIYSSSHYFFREYCGPNMPCVQRPDR